MKYGTITLDKIERLIDLLGGEEGVDIVLQGKAILTVPLTHPGSTGKVVVTRPVRPTNPVAEVIDLCGLAANGDAGTFMVVCALEALQQAFASGRSEVFVSKDTIQRKYEDVKPGFVWPTVRNIFTPKDGRLPRLSSRLEPYGYEVRVENGGLVARVRDGWTRPS